MQIAKLLLRDFRCHEEFLLDFSPGFNLFLGDNARGKTSILEAAHFLATWSSFRALRSSDMIRHGAESSQVAGKVGESTLRVVFSKEQRQSFIGREKCADRDHWRKLLQTVPFTTADNQIAKAGAGVRRRFLDSLIAAQFAPHAPALVDFKKLLRSRNLLLKKGVDRDSRGLFDTITAQFALASGQIARTRGQWTRKLSPLARLAYRKLSGGGEDLQLSYHDTGEGALGEKLIRLAREERRFRATLAGAQLDDLLLTLDGQPVTQFASEGQQRSVALALRLAQVELLKGLHGSWPVILLDDVMGELDEGRRNRLIELGNQCAQVLLTATEINWDQPQAENSKVFNIRK